MLTILVPETRSKTTSERIPDRDIKDRLENVSFRFVRSYDYDSKESNYFTLVKALHADDYNPGAGQHK